MIDYDDLPEDNADLAKIKIDFPRLDDDTADSCPCPMQDIIDYLVLEGETVVAADLEFIRTALVENHRYWIWRFRDEDGDECYATVQLAPDSSRCIGYDQNWHSLTPEQYILGDYHEVF